ncbi:hypothetical protein OAG62_00670, partial [bacterium]|nr:hypothetical protein [bacterium]
ITVCADGCDYTSINAAISAASDGDVIQLAAETYFEGQVIDASQGVTLRGVLNRAGGPASVLDGGGKHRVIGVGDGSSQSSQDGGSAFENLVIQNGIASADADQDGGGMAIRQGVPVSLVNCLFRNNVASGRGGGLFSRTVLNFTTIEMVDCVFEGNSAGLGAGVFNGQGSTLNLVDCHFRLNIAGNGGGLYGVGSNSLTLAQCVFTNNAASGSGGGLLAGAPHSLSDCIFEGNSAARGGGAQLSSDAYSNVERCRFSYNSADEGGGLSAVQSSPHLNACVFEGNLAEFRGGGVYSSNGTLPMLDSCLFAGNASASGAVLYSHNGSMPALLDCVLCGGNAFRDIQTQSGWDDLGGNCARLACEDGDRDGDGLPDCEGLGEDSELFVPVEYPTIELAIDHAADGAVIEIAAGVYFPSVTLNTLGKAITLRGAIDESGSPMTVIDGDGARRVLLCDYGEGGTTVFENLVIQNGFADMGGGMKNAGARPVIRNCTFVGNSSLVGGGMYNSGGIGPTLSRCTLCGNHAGQIFGQYADAGGNCIAYSCDDADADGIPDKCSDDDVSTLMVPSDYALIEDAVEAAGYGDTVLVEAGNYAPSRSINPGGKPITIRGAVDATGLPATFIDGGGEIRVLECSSGENAGTVFENLVIQNGFSTGDGGGMFVNGSSPTLVNCKFAHNSATLGGGMCLRSSRSSIVGCTFEENSASDDGGGCYVSGGAAVLQACAFSRNSAGQDGGGGCYVSGSSLIQDCEFFQNSATGTGGGSYVSSASIEGCRFSGNVAEFGGAMYFSGDSSELGDSIICENSLVQIFGQYQDLGGNCIACSCDDQDRDGFPDVCGREENQSDPLRVPSEYESIEAAIDAAICGDTIVIAAGVYFETRSVNSGGKAITIRGEVDSSGIPITVIDGGGLIRGLECVAGETDSTVFENLVIQNGLGQAESTYGGAVVAGGMFIFQSSPIVRNCMFRENQSAYGGGMILAFSNATLDGCAFEENASTGSAGGIGMNISNPTLVNCMFLANTSSSSGGGLLCNQQSNPNLTNCTFEGNIAGSSGGAMLNSGESAATLTDCLFTSNVAGVGGGIRNFQSSLNLIDCVFEANSATEQGGAISFEEDAGSQIEGCFFNLNRAIDAGDGIYLSGTVTLGVLMTACVFTECCQNLPIGFGADPELGNDLGWPCADCVGDVTCNAMVNAGDLGRLLSAWDTTQQRYDLNQDGIVDAADLGLLLGSWGVCE